MPWETSADAVFVVDEDCAVQHANQSCDALYGINVESSLGRPLGELIAGQSAPLPWRERADRARAGHHWHGVELHKASSGVQAWIRGSVEGVQGQVILRSRQATGREVVDRTQALPDLLFEAMGVGGLGVWMDDGVTQQLDWSPQARAIYGQAPDEPVTHEIFFEKIRPEDRARFAAEIQEVLATRQDKFNFQFRVGKGEDAREVESFGRAVFRGDGKLLLGIGGVRDVTERAQMQARIEALEQQVASAQKLNVAGQLASGIAHDFNNLLTGILGYSEMVCATQLDEGQRRDMEQVLTAVDRGSDLTRQLLSFVRPQPSRRKHMDLDETVVSACRLMRRVVPESVWFEPELCGGGWRVHADAAELHQVLSNLLINAAHAMPNGGTVSVRTEQRMANGYGDAIVLEVSDTGTGIHPDMREHIFEPFFTTKPKGSGTGLGLSVVRGIVERCGGRIEVDSVVDLGTTFRVFLPRCDALEDPMPPLVSNIRALNAAQHTILLVEDETMVRHIARRVLEAEGFAVLEAMDGCDALTKLHHQPNIDLLVTDVIMPRMTGPCLVDQLRLEQPELRVLYTSGYPEVLLDSRFELGREDSALLMKPYTRAQLLDAVAGLLSDASAAQSRSGAPQVQ